MVDVKGGYWETFSSSVLTLTPGNALKRRVARILNVEGMRAYKELMLTLNGAAAGSAASATHKRVVAREDAAGNLSGLRTIETITDVGRNTASADETDIDTKILALPSKPTYVANLDGNPRSVPGGVGS